MNPRMKLAIALPSQYFEEQGFTEEDIDFDETGEKAISLKEYEAIQKILSCEASINLLAHAIGDNMCGSITDNMTEIRREYINAYEKEFGKKYVIYNKDLWV